MPNWILVINYWLHLLSTVIWIGGLATLTLVAWPGLLGALDEAHEAKVLAALDRRFRPLANLSLVMLLITGMFQMSGDTNYHGFLQIDSLWAVGLLAKHIVYIAMIAVSAVLQFVMWPSLERARLAASHARASEVEHAQVRALRIRFRQLSVVNLALGIIVLLLTAVITAQ